ncbi:hypothetical protein [Chamaesiphon sp. VAR_69_metabat_338]|nr:hypothetical protein [Chamaesiphon sp. VAR_69_metabat_338]
MNFNCFKGGFCCQSAAICPYSDPSLLVTGCRDDRTASIGG